MASLMVLVSHSIWAVRAIDVVEQQLGQIGVVASELAGQCWDQGGVFDPHPSAGQLGEHLRTTLPGDQRLDHRPARDPQNVGRHGRELDHSVLEEFL